MIIHIRIWREKFNYIFEGSCGDVEGTGVRKVNEENYNKILADFAQIKDGRIRKKMSDESIKSFSDNLERNCKELREVLLPREEKDEGNFEKFLQEMEIESRISHPLLLLKTNDNITPWWLIRTYDDKGYWGTRYAMSTLPYRSNLSPSEMKSIRIGIITRPTYDLRHQYDLATSLKNSLKKIGEKFEIEKVNIHNGKKNSVEKFFGVTKEEFFNGLQETNIILYYGHFSHNVENPHFSSFVVSQHPDDIELKKKIEEILSKETEKHDDNNMLPPLPPEEISRTISIDDINDIDIRNKHFLLGACSSAGTPVEIGDTSVAEIFLKKNCIAFLGTLYPVYAIETGEFIKKVFYEALQNRNSLAEAVRKTRESFMKEKTENIHWMAFSLWGHPKTMYVPTPKGPFPIYYSKSAEHIFLPLIEKSETYPLKFEKKVLPAQKLPVIEPSVISFSECPIPQCILMLEKWDKEREGEKICILGSIFKSTTNNCSLFVFKKKLGKKEIKNLEGLKIGYVDLLVNTTVMTRIALEDMKKGITKNIKWIKAPSDRLTLLEQGELDGSILFLQDLEKLRGDDRFYEFKIASYINKNILEAILPEAILITAKDNISKYPDLFKMFISRYQYMINLIKDKPDEITMELDLPKGIYKIREPCQISDKITVDIAALISYSERLKEIGFSKRILTEDDFAFRYL